MRFPISGVECPVWLPPGVAFLVALLTTPAGISGAFLLIPFQMSVLGFVSPAVTPTNLLYNMVAVPGGVGGYIRDHRIVWPIAWTICAGSVPGVVLGAIVRVRYLPDPRHWRLFVGCVLLYLGASLLRDGWRRRGVRGVPVGGAFARTVSASARRIDLDFQGKRYAFNPVVLAAVALLVGVAGGIYGVGGGAMIAPFAMTILELPVHSVAGAALLGTLATSVAGVAAFGLLGASAVSPGVGPDWALGLLFGAGGLAGSYFGACIQKRIPELWIRLFLGLVLTALAVNYVGRSLLGGRS